MKMPLLCASRDEDGDRIANNRVRVHFKKPRPCDKWACLLTMESIDKTEKSQKKGLAKVFSLFGR